MKKIIFGLLLSTILISSKSIQACRLERVTLWTNSVVPIEIDSKFTIAETNIIITALNEMMSLTNIVFKKHAKNSNEKYLLYTKILPREEIGFKGGICPKFGVPSLSQMSVINFWSVRKSTVLHETMHALGFNHEQCRADRDSFVDIKFLNILPNWLPNFTISFDGRDIGTYNINSIMHYSFNSGAIISDQPTIELKGSSNREFGNNQLAASDISSINSAYGISNQSKVPLDTIKSMAIGETRTIRVESNKEYNFFNIAVRQGQTYRMDAFNRDRWKGAYRGNPSSADGLRERVNCKRVPGNKYMRMLCEIYTRQESNSANFSGFRFGVHTDNNNMSEFTVQPNGEGFLMFYANDCLGTYIDNSGSIGVNITRVR